MTVAVGQILDKYELLEKVGQGGMAVVYRGLDHSLHREVAIKVLHQHLAEHAEARDRFAREARAVAKLRHENILEIFDFSGKDTDESYIVTEFISGQTLTQFIAEHPLRYPEIGAMIVVQVCRALNHAHSLGVLHRDVKPENIMIRHDGVVKLTDFGIAQMLDMKRLTVTGQLLGSPAYMSPEHVEGKPLDFRTDVFAVGIVLYQLVVGELPFQGSNPHELLKRIAESRYTDPRKANPLVGNELGGIINCALARDPDDRYNDISEMLGALEHYLKGSGLTDCRTELGRFFAAPVAYEMALRERLLDHLSKRGCELLPTDQIAALELFNRVLTVDPGNQTVLTQIAMMSRRRRWLRTAFVVGLALAACLLLVSARTLWRSSMHRDRSAAASQAHAPRAALPSANPDGPGKPGSQATPQQGPSHDGGSSSQAGQATSVAPGAAPETPAHAALADDRPAADTDTRLPRRDPPKLPESQADAGPAAELPRRPPEHAAPRIFTLRVAPRQAEYRINEGAWQIIHGSATLRMGPGEHTLEVRNPTCCQARSHQIRAGDEGGPIQITLGYLPATITPICKVGGVRVQIDDMPARLDRRTTIPITAALGLTTVTVTFIGEVTDQHTVQVRYNEAKDIRCRLDETR